MSQVSVELPAAVRRTFRVEQVAGMLDVAVGEWIGHSLVAEVPGLDEAWTIGAIVGPSGSGKTTLARAAFAEAVYEAREWARERAVVDVLGDPGDETSGREGEGESGGRSRSVGAGHEGRTMADRNVCPTVKEIARVLTAVGLGSVRTWLKPYRALSAGERFRADLARGVIEEGFTRRRGGAEKTERRVLVVDEFTSALDRTIAKTTSAALGRMLRQKSEVGGQKSARAGLRFVAVSCHTDILPWLAPDWVVELGGESEEGVWQTGMSAPRAKWDEWRQPEIELEVRRVPQAMWERFARHHYLAGGLAASATCYGAFVGGLGLRAEGKSEREGGCEGARVVGFCAVVAALGWKKTKRITRLVVLPEFQGLGIASRLLAEVARREAARGNRVTITASHPAIVAHCSRSALWRLVGVKKQGSTRQVFAGREIRCSMGRAVAGFEWVGA